MTDERLRLDKWLWHARMCKTRAQAAALCSTGSLQLNGQPVHKPAQVVKIGDIVIMPRGSALVTFEVLGLGIRRGPFAEASALYRVLGDEPARQSAWEPLLFESGTTPAPKREG